ncbi:YD repeat (two copies) [Variovorax sp. PBS-H4]|nr:YD repeat (two copies) [Variovorax sp. PBS-H4]
MSFDRQSDRHVSARFLSRTVFAACLCAAALAGVPAQAGSVSYTYDALGRLASTVYSDGTSTTTITYSYDAAGNRTSVAATSS